MSDPQQPTFLVSAYTTPVVVRVNGKANYLNCNAFREFMETIIANGSRYIYVDFENCKGMDSTFLGILAGTAIELRKEGGDGKLTVGNLSERNTELIQNLGLHNLLDVAKRGVPAPEAQLDPLKNEEVGEARNILRAHENLTEANTDNAVKFQDVIAFLRNQVEKHD